MNRGLRFILLVLLAVSLPSIVSPVRAAATNARVTNDNLSNKSQFEPVVGINPMNSSVTVAAAIDFRDGLTARDGKPIPRIWYYVSLDSGKTYQNAALPLPKRPPPTDGFFDALVDPSVAFDNSGNVIIATQAFDISCSGMPLVCVAADATIFVSRFRLDPNPVNPTALTFIENVLINLGSGLNQFDKPYAAIDNFPASPFKGRVYVAYNGEAGIAGVYLAFSTDGGHTFTSSKIPSACCSFALPAAGPSGLLYVASLVDTCSPNGTRCAQVVKSTDGGSTFTSPVVVSEYKPIRRDLVTTNFNVLPAITLAADDLFSNLVYVAWDQDNSAATRGADIFFSRSTDGGKTWSTPIIVNDDPTPSNDQWWPAMSVSQDVVNIIFYDRREDFKNVKANIFYATSSNGGLTFSPNARITDLNQASDLSCSLCSGSVQSLGDYIGIASVAPSNSQVVVYPVWTDARNSQYDIYSDKIVQNLGGSPYAQTWDGSQWRVDNNLLPQSLDPSRLSLDVVDHYELQQPLASYNGNYLLKIREMENDHVFLDQVRLVAADHQSNLNVGLTPTGQIMTYSNPSPPVSGVNSSGQTVLTFVSKVDGAYYQGFPGDFVLVDFGSVDISQGAKLVVRSDPPRKLSIHVQVLNASRSWNDVAVIEPRMNWSTDIVNLKTYLPDPTGHLQVRLFLTQAHKIDYVGLDNSPEASFTVLEAKLVNAYHSVIGDVTPLVLLSDDLRAEIHPAEEIYFIFNISQAVSGARNFIIVVEGYYTSAT